VGWFESVDLVSVLRSAFWSLPAGCWSEPTGARGGVHVALVIERRESKIPAFKDVEAKIRSREERARLNERMKEYLAELERKSYLYLDPPVQAAGFRSSTGEAPGGNEFPLVAPDTAATGDGSVAAGDTAVDDTAVDDTAVDDTAADPEAAEEKEIERGLEEIEAETPPEDAPAPDAPPGSSP
jgi:hypothetical protein